MSGRPKFNNQEVQLAIERTHGRSLSEIARHLMENDTRGRTITVEAVRVRLANSEKLTRAYEDAKARIEIRKVQGAEAAWAHIAEAAVKGDLKQCRILLDLLDRAEARRAVQRHEISGPDGGPVQVDARRAVLERAHEFVAELEGLRDEKEQLERERREWNEGHP